MRTIDVLGAVLVLAGLAGAMALLTAREDIAGTATVVDGDTVRLGQRTIRLEGLDAPELGQTCQRESGSWPCGLAAKEEVVRLVAGRSLICRARGADKYGRALARCEVDGVDIAARLVERGLAVAYGAYEREEAGARLARRGLWNGSFERPADWRRSHPRAVFAQAD